jgi:RNA polymerase sigma-70 factor (ECF subfamily)
MEEISLIAKILARDRQALYTFYRTYRPRLLRLIRSKVGDKNDCEEILQDTLFAFLEALRDFHGRSSLETFLFSICQYKIVDFYRRKKVKHLVFSRVPQLEALISPLFASEDELDAFILKEKIRSVFSRLLPRYRRVLVLKYSENLSVAEIAEKLAVTVKSAESQLFRARKAFVKVYSTM